MFPELKVGLFRLRLVARQPMPLPAYKGSVLRGGFGSAFRRVACALRADDCGGCGLRQACPYAYVFETSPPEGSDVLRTFRDIPRPFVIQPPEDDRTFLEPGDEMEFGLVLIGRGVSYLPYFVVAFRQLGRTGIGPRRAGFELAEVRQVAGPVWAGEAGGVGEEREQGKQGARSWTVFDGTTDSGEVRVAGVSERCVGAKEVAAAAARLPSECIQVTFKTPTRLKAEAALRTRPEFHLLVRALLRRASSLAYFHHDRRLELDYREWIRAAREVSLLRDETEWVSWRRYSNRQRVRMDLGGVVGTVVYKGELGRFRELLLLGALVHVGKNTTFGLGRYSLDVTDLGRVRKKEPSRMVGDERSKEAVGPTPNDGGMC